MLGGSMNFLLFAAWASLAAVQISCWTRIRVSRRWAYGAVGGAVLFCAVHQAVLATLAEDAFISFRYAANLAEGNGLVFNLGERVEGYSNFLWILLIAIPRAVFGTDIILAARILGFACTLATVVLAAVLTGRITKNDAAAALTATLVGASSSLAAYGPSGLETPLFALLLIAAVLAIQSRKPLVAGLLLALAVTTRPDGAAAAVAVAVWLVTGAALPGRRWPAVLTFAAGVLAIGVPWTVWRLAYYGQLLPNALAAKSGRDLGWQIQSGMHYVASFAVAVQALIVLLAAAVVALVAGRRRTAPWPRRIVWLLLTMTAAQVLLVVAVGGDWMPAWRFCAPLMPLVAVIVVAAWSLPVEPGAQTASPVARPLDRRAAPVLVATTALVLVMLSVNDVRMKDGIALWRQQVHDLSLAGAWMGRTLPAGTVVSTYANGAFSYRAGTELVVVDQLGLTDEHIARHGKRDPAAPIGHAAYDYDYIVNDRRPEVIITWGGQFSPSAHCEIRPELAGRYRAAAFQHAGGSRWVTVAVRADRADQLVALLDADPEFILRPCPPTRGARGC